MSTTELGHRCSGTPILETGLQPITIRHLFQRRRHELITGCRAFSAGFQVVRCPNRFRPANLDKFNGTKNLLEFLQIYTTAIRAAGGDKNVMANYLPTVLEGSAWSWLLNLPVGSIYTWEQLCDLLIVNFQGTYNRPGKEADLTESGKDPMKLYVSTSKDLARFVIQYQRSQSLLLSKLSKQV